MTRTTVEITTDVRDNLKILKGILNKSNMTEVIRELMILSGHNDAFFRRVEEIRNRTPVRMQGDSPD